MFYLLWMCRSYRVATVDKDWLLDTICSHEIQPLAGRFRQAGSIWPNFSYSGYTLHWADIDERLRTAGFPSPLVPL